MTRTRERCWCRRESCFKHTWAKQCKCETKQHRPSCWAVFTFSRVLFLQIKEEKRAANWKCWVLFARNKAITVLEIRSFTFFNSWAKSQLFSYRITEGAWQFLLSRYAPVSSPHALSLANIFLSLSSTDETIKLEENYNLHQSERRALYEKNKTKQNKNI